MGWRAVLAGIGAGVGGFFLGGPAAAVALGTGAYQAVGGYEAEKKAEKQLQGAATQQAGAFAPYNQLGLQAGNSLAQALGLPGVPTDGSGMPGATPAATSAQAQPWRDVMFNSAPDVPGMRGHQTATPMPADSTTLQDMLARGAQARALDPRTTRGASSYRTAQE